MGIGSVLQRHGEGFNAPYLGEPHIPQVDGASIPPRSPSPRHLRARATTCCAPTARSTPTAWRPTGRLHLPYGAIAPVVAVAITVDPTTGGYWIATSTGEIASFDAPSYGSPLASSDNKYDGVPVSALAATTSGAGYYALRANGTVDTYGATFHGSPAADKSMPEGALASALAVDPATGGYYVGVDDTPLDGYMNPMRAVTSLLPQEVDQGVDYCAAGPIYALGDGTVVSTYDNQWPSGVFISYRLSNGPAKGHYVYVAEDVTPR